jgi:apolipoprotein N-acyltransferase
LLDGLLAAALFIAANRVHPLFAWGVCGPLVVGTRRATSWRDVWLLGAIFGIAIAAGESAPWVSVAAAQYFAWPRTTALALVGLLAVACGGSFGALLTTVFRYAVRRVDLSSVLMAGAVWVTWEWLTRAIFPHYPWTSLAATQGASLATLQLARFIGQGGLSFVIAAAGTAFGLALEHGITRPAAPVRLFAGALGLVLFVIVSGKVQLATLTSGRVSGCTVSTIDAEIPSGAMAPDAVLQRYETLSAKALTAQPSALVWPESAIPGYPDIDLPLQRRLDRLSAEWKLPLIAGGPRIGWGPDWQRRLFNSVYRIAPGEPMQVYDKRALVPFAEYWPFPIVPRPSWFIADEVNAGSRPVVFAAGACRLGILICFEAERSDFARELVQRGARALLVLSNDAQLPEQAIGMEMTQARLRAIETGVPVLRAANHGWSVAIDPSGQIRQETHGGVLTAVIIRAVPAPALVLGPVFLALCGIVTFAVLAVGVWAQWSGNSDPSRKQTLPKLSL